MRYLVLIVLVAAGCSTANAPPAPARNPSAPQKAHEPAASDAAGPFKVGGDVLAPALLTRIAPEYPKGGIRGRVLFRAVISESGEVESLELIQSDHPLLTKAASDAIRQWRYRPATKDGRPVRVFLAVTTIFNMR